MVVGRAHDPIAARSAVKSEIRDGPVGEIDAADDRRRFRRARGLFIPERPDHSLGRPKQVPSVRARFDRAASALVEASKTLRLQRSLERPEVLAHETGSVEPLDPGAGCQLLVVADFNQVFSARHRDRLECDAFNDGIERPIRFKRRFGG
jgi:hypothetical protein